jgi:hypothetical protein
MPELTDDLRDEAFFEDSVQITNVLSLCGSAAATSLPPVNVNEPENPFHGADPSNIDLSFLTQLRFSHQTKQAASGIRTSKKSSHTSTTPAEKDLTNRQVILQGFAEIIRERGEKGVGTGLERAARWRNPAPGGRSGEIDGISAPTLAAGNSANAAAVADGNAKRVCTSKLHLLTSCGFLLFSRH